MNNINDTSAKLDDPPRDVKVSRVGILVRVLVWLFCAVQVAVVGYPHWAPGVMHSVHMLLNLAAGVVLTIFVTEMLIRGQARLLRTGHAALARIEKVETAPKSGMRLTYSFDAEGFRWTAVRNTSSWRPFAVGEVIPVVYPPGQPRKSQPVVALFLVSLRRAPNARG